MLPQLAIAALVVAVWQWATTAGAVSPLLLPRPEVVWEHLLAILSTPETLFHARVTLMEFFAAFSFSLVTGAGFGILIGLRRHWGDLFEPIVISLYTVPIILLYPLCLLFFGFGSASKIAFAGVYGFFPLCINTLKGLRTIQPQLVKVARAFGASPAQMVRHVMLPAASPLIIAGVHLAIVLNLIGVVAGEMITSLAGLGNKVAEASELMNSPDMYAYILLILAAVIVLNVLLQYISADTE